MIFKEYLELEKLSHNTIKAYTMYERIIKAQLAGKALSQNEVYHFIRKHNHAVARAFLKRYLTFLKAKDIIVPKLKGRQATRLSETLTAEQIDRLCEISPPPYNFLWKVLFEGGLRISAALALKKRDFLNENNTITVRSKGKEYKAMITQKTKLGILPYLERLSSLDCLVFPFNRDHARYKLKKIGETLLPNKRWHTHLFRASCATHLRNQGMDLKLIQAYLNHVKIDTTARYTRLENVQVGNAWRGIMEK